MVLPRRILACTDLSTGGNEAVAYAAELARVMGAELVVAHLFDGYVVSQRELLRAPERTGLAARRRHLVDEVRAVVERVAPGVAARVICEHADAHRDIPNLAAREGAELIVLGRYGHSGFARFFMGSVTDSVVRNASVPVLAVSDPAQVVVQTGGAHDVQQRS